MLGERVGLHRGLAVVAGLVGVIVVLQPGSVPLGLGQLAALAAALTGAFVSVIVRRIGQDERSAVLMLYPMMLNFMATGAVLPFVYRPMPVEHLGQRHLHRPARRPAERVREPARAAEPWPGGGRPPAQRLTLRHRPRPFARRPRISGATAPRPVRAGPLQCPAVRFNRSATVGA
jgi:hypothetical protein